MNKNVEEIFNSSLMKKGLRFRMVLPEIRQSDSENYPILYLLHGLFGNCDNWFELCGLSTYLTGRKMAVVMPDGGDQWYSNSAQNELDKYETFFIKEFIPAIENKFKIGGTREKRAIAGLSMGGYGSFKFALKRPDMFAFAGSMSGAFDAPSLSRNSKESEKDLLLPSVLEIFGEEKSRSRIENDLFEIINAIEAEKISQMPQLYFDCGTDDVFLNANRELVKSLTAKQIKFEFNTVTGSHDWSYWDQQIQIVLDRVDKIFRN